MSLKNRNETKLLMENWRKVLKEGLYDSDPELLEEGAVQNAIMAALFAGSMLAAKSAQAEVSPKQLGKAGVTSPAQAGKFSSYIKNLLAKNHSIFKNNTKLQSNAMQVADALVSPELVELSPEQISLLQDIVGINADWFVGFKKRFAAAAKEIEAAKKKAASFDVEDLTLGGGGELVDANNKAELEVAINNMDNLKAEFQSETGNNYKIEHVGNKIMLVNNATDKVVLSLDNIIDEELSDMLDQGVGE